MKKLIVFSVVLGLAMSIRALPLYDNFSTYGAAGTWAENPTGNGANGGPPFTFADGEVTISGAPALGVNAPNVNVAPSGESWIPYTNVTSAFQLAALNVAIVNYFSSGQPGNTDTVGYSVPGTLFPGPFVSGNDTSGYNIWTPGWWSGATATGSPSVNATGTGGVGACLQFATPVSSTVGNKIFASFFVDVPDCTGPYGAGQSLLHAWSAGFLDAAEIPTTGGANQNAMPTIFEKFNQREVSTSTWRPGIGDNTVSSGTASVTAGPYSGGTIHFIVISYEFNGGSGLDEERVWVDPANTSFGNNVQPTSSGSRLASSGDALPNAGGFFFTSFVDDSGGEPNSGTIFNSLHIGTNWAYVTGGPQFTSYAPATINAIAGQTITLNSTAVAGGVPITETWGVTNGATSGTLTPGGRFSVAANGALTISAVQDSDAGTYTLQPTTPITDGTAPGNNYPVSSPATVVTVSPAPTFTAENASALGSGQFQLTFNNAAALQGVSYRIWSTTSLANTPVDTTWTLVTSGTFTSGVNTYTDTAASGAAQFYTITVP